MWVHDLIAGHPGDAQAIVDFNGDTVTYGDLRQHAVDLADILTDRGVRPGDRVMLVAENCAMGVVAVMAASRLSAWILPVNARQTPEELQAIRDHSGARVMLFTAHVSDEAMARATHFGAAHTADLPCGPVWLTETADTNPEPVSDDPKTRVAALLYTTGTTSAPKGVMLSHASLCWNANASAELRGMTPDDTVLGVLPGTHIFGFSSTMLATMQRGATIRFLSRFTPEAVVNALADGASVMPAVPQMYAHILAYLAREGRTLSAPNLHYISAGGAPLDPDWKARTEAVFGLPLNNGFGMTECSPTVAATRNDAPTGDMSCGPPVPDVTIRIGNPDEDGIGELLIRSPGLMLGYYRNEQATDDALQDGWLHSGDLARIDDKGHLHIVGRLKELIVRSGFNVYPPEIEAMLTRHPDVDVAAVVGRPVPGDEEIIAFLMTRDGVEASDIMSWLRERLVAYKIPQHLFIVDALPAAATGKILKHKLLGHFSHLLNEE
ncbi:class I adenylate-forming enzyme family protein [Shimia biformata]|uniref:class I adenylate-forming enzyme family protein n=1 Tax=Shimia biformata TaxID=1294299 RepID=UPI00195230BF|nr:AMP-binding protein [Shimia biformata]